MSRPKKTTIEREAMRERILSAADELLETLGPGEVSIRAVTARLGVSPMTFYSYFRSRDELLTSLSERQLRILQQSGEQFLAQAQHEGAVSVLNKVADLFGQSALQRPRSYLLQWAMPLDETSDRCLHRRLFEIGLNFLSRLTELGIAQGCFSATDPQKAALMLFSLFNGPLLLFTSGRMTDSDRLAAMWEETKRLAIEYLSTKDEEK